MPGAGYNQPEKKLAELQKVYTQNGGKLTDTIHHLENILFSKENARNAVGLGFIGK